MSEEGITRILSLGAGVQSSTLALMMAHGELEPADHAVFADTGDEPDAVYEWLDFLEGEIAQAPHPFPIHRVRKGLLSLDSTTPRVSMRSGNVYLAPMVPAHTLNPDGKKGMSYRQCTRNHKITPIQQAARKLADVPRGPDRVYVHMLIGISTDEIVRMKASQVDWIEHVYPLIDAGMSRTDCLEWFDARGYDRPPRSACVYCPYRSDKEWAELKANDPKGFQAAVEYEEDLQWAYEQTDTLDAVPYLHQSLVPLSEVEFDEDDDNDGVGFNAECEGMCGL